MIFIIIILTIYLGLVVTIKKKKFETKIVKSQPNEIKYCLGSFISIFLLEFVALEYIFWNILHNYYLVIYLLFLGFLHKSFFSKVLKYCGVQIYYHYRYIDNNYKLYYFDVWRKKIKHVFMDINTKMLVKFNINFSVKTNELYYLHDFLALNILFFSIKIYILYIFVFNLVYFFLFKMDPGYDGLINEIYCGEHIKLTEQGKSKLKIYGCYLLNNNIIKPKLFIYIDFKLLYED